MRFCNSLFHSSFCPHRWFLECILEYWVCIGRWLWRRGLALHVCDGRTRAAIVYSTWVLTSYFIVIFGAVLIREY